MTEKKLLEHYQPTADEVRGLVDKINQRLEDRWDTIKFYMKEERLMDPSTKKELRGMKILVSDISGKVRLSASVEDYGYPQWYGLSTLLGFLYGYESATHWHTPMPYVNAD